MFSVKWAFTSRNVGLIKAWIGRQPQCIKQLKQDDDAEMSDGVFQNLHRDYIYCTSTINHWIIWLHFYVVNKFCAMYDFLCSTTKTRMCVLTKHLEGNYLSVTIVKLEVIKRFSSGLVYDGQQVFKFWSQLHSICRKIFLIYFCVHFRFIFIKLIPFWTPATVFLQQIVIIWIVCVGVFLFS